MFFELWYIGGKHSLKFIAEELCVSLLAQLEVTQLHKIEVVRFVTPLTDGKKPLERTDVPHEDSPLLNIVVSDPRNSFNGDDDILKWATLSTDSTGEVSYQIQFLFILIQLLKINSISYFHIFTDWF